MRKLFAASFLFLCASASYGQGAAYTAGPFNTSGPLYVCTTPVTTTPCSSFASLFSNAALSSAISNPFPMTAGVAITFYVTPGQYAVQMPNAGFSQIVTIGGGSSGLSYTGTTPPIPAVTTSASPLCPTSGSTTCNFIFDDGLVVATDVTTAVNGTITCPNSDCNFTTITQPQFGSTIVGMQAWTVNTATIATSPVPTCAISTIATVAAQQITLVSGSCASANTANQTLVIGHKDDANLNTASTNAGCGTLGLPSLSANPIAPAGTQAGMLVATGHFQTRPTNCSLSAANGEYGDPSLVGSPIATTLIMTPDFPFTVGNCAGVASFGITGSYNVCFGPAPVLWYGIDIVGYGFASCGTTALVLTSAGAGGIMNLSNHNNICVNNANLIGTIFYSANYRFENGGIQNVGGVAARAVASAGFPVYSNTNYLVNQQSTTNTGIGLQVDAGAILVDHSSIIGNTLVNGTFTGEGTVHGTFNGGAGLNATELNSSTAVMNCNGCTFNAVIGAPTGFTSPGASSAAILLNASGSKANIQGTTFWQGAPTSGHYLFTVAGSVFNDLGGNVCPATNSGSAPSIAGAVNQNSSVNSGFFTGPINANLSSTSVISGVNCLLAPIVVYLSAGDAVAGTSCTGNTTITWTLSYTDGLGNAQTSTAVETITLNGGSTDGDPLKTSFVIWPQNTTAVNIATVYAIGTGCSPGPKYQALIWSRG